MSKTKPTTKDLHDLCQKLGITKEIAGKPLNKLIEEAHASDDPRGFLEVYLPGPPSADVAGDETIEQEDESTKADPEPKAVESEPARAVPKKPTAAASTGTRLATIELPYLAEANETVNAIQRLHLEVQLHDQKTAQAAKRFHLGLLEKGARLANGRCVESFPQAVTWFLEQLAKEVV